MSEQYTNYTYAESDVPSRLLVGWRSTYNDTLVDGGPSDPGDEVDQDVGLIPADVLRNVLPGDSGTASVGLRLDDEGEMVPDGARVWMRIDVTTGANGSVAADRALAGRLELDVRYDTGVLGIGRCAGAEDDFADFGEEIFSGTFADLETNDGLSGGIELDPGLLDNGCLGPTESRCLTFIWRLPPGQGNVGRGGSVEFDVTFQAVSCGRSENPFDDGVAT